MRKIDIKKLFPHLTAVILFVAISLVYFYPVMEGLQLDQGDIQKHQATSHEIKTHLEKYDEHALWSGNMFSGMPSFLTATVRFNYNIVSVFSSISRLGLPAPASLLFLYLIGFYILLQSLRINPWLSIVGAIAFAFSSYFFIIIEAGHNSKAIAISYMAPILAGLIEAFRGRLKVGLLLIAIYTALQLYANHLQITYYLLLILLAVVIAEFVYWFRLNQLKKFFRILSFVILAGILGILPNIGNILITYEYAKESTRGKSELTIDSQGKSNATKASSGLEKDYITQWSYGIDETFSLVVPDVKGGTSVPILGLEDEVERLRKEDHQFFNILVEEYQQNQNLIISYFGNQPVTSGPVYIGVIVMLLAILALFFVKDRIILPLFIVTVITVMLSWGKNLMGFTEFFIDFIPGYNKFRAVAMILLVAEFILPLFAVLFLDRLIKEKEQILAQKKKLYTITGVFSVIILMIYVSPGTFIDLMSDKEQRKFQERIAATSGNSAALDKTYSVMEGIRTYREEKISESALRSLQFLVVALVLLALFLMDKIKRKTLIAGIGVFILIDLWIIDKQYLNNKKNNGKTGKTGKYLKWEDPSKHKFPFTPSPTDLEIFRREVARNPQISTEIENNLAELKSETRGRLDQRRVIDIQFTELMRGTHYRVLNATARMDQDAEMPYFHKTLGGYHAAKLRKYQEFIDFTLVYEHFQVQQTFAKGGIAQVRQLLPTLRMTNMLNAKYIIGPDKSGKTPSVFLENPYAMGNAWFVEKVKYVESPDSAIMALRTINPATTLIVEEKNSKEINGKSFQTNESNSINLTNYSPNVLSYSYTTTSEQLAVFSEIFYQPGWKAYVNGEEMPFFRANYILRAMVVPKGKGTIEFKFEPILYEVGEKLTWVSSIIFLLLIGFVTYSEVNRKEE